MVPVNSKSGIHTKSAHLKFCKMVPVSSKSGIHTKSAHYYPTNSNLEKETYPSLRGRDGAESRWRMARSRF